MGTNTLTNLIPVIYEALDVVSREMIGFIPAVARDTSSERAALNQTILVPITQPQTAADNTPAVTPPDTGDQTIGNVSMTITKSKHVPIRWNGEQQKGMKGAGTYNGVLRDQFAQGFRTLANLIETDLFNAAYQGASRAYGNPGTAPFGTAGDLSDSAQLRKILDDNGCPQSDLHLVLGSGAVANLRGKQTILLKANENGSDAFRRTGAIAEVPLDGFMLHNSNSIQQVTKGTGANYVTSGDTAPGVNTSALITGTGTVLAGDVVTFAADANNKYVVNTGVTAPGTITFGAPGARVDIPTANAMTIGNSYTPNVGFTRSAIQLITRAPAMPEDESGRPADLAEDSVMVTDPVSGTRAVSLNAEDMAYKKPNKYGKATWYAVMDGNGLEVGDYFIGAMGTFFIAAMQLMLPIFVVECNRKVSIFRPQQQTGNGLQGYGGTTAANQTLIMAGVPCSILQGTKGEKSEANLPGDTRSAWWTVLMPASVGSIKPDDIIEDELGARYIVSSNELSDLGWRCTAMIAIP